MHTNGQKYKALPFQKKTVFIGERKFSGRFINGNEMGLGKTLTSLWFIKRATLGSTYPALVILPKIARTQWYHACVDLLGIHPDILETRTPRKGYKDLQPIQLINWDIISFWRDWLEKRKYQTVILDECQHATNPDAKRTKTALSLVKQCPFALPLSGTPLENRPSELYPLVKALHPEEWPTKTKYYHKYCGPRWTSFGWDFTGASNLDELHDKLKSTCMVRYKKSEVLNELPDKSRHIIPVEMRKPEIYYEARDDFLGWLAANYPQRLKKSVKAAALVRTGHLLRLVAKLKLKNVVEWINHRLTLTEDEKLVIFGIHKKCVRALERRVECRNVRVDGSVIGKKRDKAITQFKHDPTTRAIIGNLTAMGRAVNLIEASTACMVELGPKPGLLLQGEDRIHRIGQTSKSFIYYFIASGTIEEKSLRLLQRKQRNISATLDGDELEEDFDLYDMLLEELENE